MTPLVLISLNQWKAPTALRVKLLKAELALGKCLDMNWSSGWEQVIGFDEGDNSSHHFQDKKVTTTSTRTSQIFIFDNIFNYFRKSTTDFAIWTKRKKDVRGVARYNSSV